MSDPYGVSLQIIALLYKTEKYSFRGIIIATILHGASLRKPDRFPTCAHLVCSVYDRSRDCHRPFLPMYGDVA